MDEDLRRRKSILNVILIGSIGMLVILDLLVLFHSLQSGAAYRGIPFGEFSALPAFFIFLYALLRWGFFDLSSLLLMGAYFASTSYAAYRWGVGMPSVLIAYALIIVMATILRGTKFGFLVTGLIAAFIVPIWYAQFHGLITTQAQRPQATDAITFSALYVLIMVVAWLYDREITRSLRRARNSEAALKEERDLLEVKVAERTDELRRTQLEKMQQLNRLAELGQLSSGLFHDLLNLLNALSLRSDKADGMDPSLSNAFNTAKQIEGFMRAVQKQIGRVDGKEAFSLAEGVNHTIQLVNYKANKERVAIAFSHDPEADLSYFGTPYKFQEVVINLLFNAIESYERTPPKGGGIRRVTVNLRGAERAFLLQVEDNGCGMTPDVQARIFEPFFTTKDAAKGIGIGLATIKKIIEEDFGGTIAAESRSGAGSKFTVTFPKRHEGPPYHDQQRIGTYPDAAAP